MIEVTRVKAWTKDGCIRISGTVPAKYRLFREVISAELLDDINSMNPDTPYTMDELGEEWFWEYADRLEAQDAGL